MTFESLVKRSIAPALLGLSALTISDFWPLLVISASVWEAIVVARFLDAWRNTP